MLGHADHVNVIGHQAVAQNIERKSCTVVPEQIEVHAAVVFHEEHALTIVAPLGDVVRQAGEHDSRDTRHASSLHDSVNK